MIRSYTMLVSLAVTALVACAIPSVSSAQKPYTLSVPTTEIVLTPTQSYYDFVIELHNTTDSKITVRMSRIENRLPDESWSSAICSGSYCFPPDVSNPQPETLEANGDKHISLNVYSSSVQVGQVGRWKLVIDSGPGSQADTITFTATVDQGSSVPGATTGPLVGAFPNPATTYVQLPLPQGSSNGVRVEIFSLQGERITTLDASSLVISADNTARASVEMIPPGTYLYRVLGNGGTLTGPLSIQR